MAAKFRVVPGTALPVVCIYFPPPLILNVAAVGAIVPVVVEPEAMVKTLKAVAEPLIDCVVPLKITVPVPAVNVPLLVILPYTRSVFAPPNESDAPLLIVRLRQMPPAAPTLGILGAVDGITTSVVEVGNVLLHQLAGVFQSELTVPPQVPGVQEDVPVMFISSTAQ